MLLEIQESCPVLTGPEESDVCISLSTLWCISPQSCIIASLKMPAHVGDWPGASVCKSVFPATWVVTCSGLQDSWRHLFLSKICEALMRFFLPCFLESTYCFLTLNVLETTSAFKSWVDSYPVFRVPVCGYGGLLQCVDTAGGTSVCGYSRGNFRQGVWEDQPVSLDSNQRLKITRPMLKRCLGGEGHLLLLQRISGDSATLNYSSRDPSILL